MTFKLYPEEKRWWSFADYRAVLDAMKRTSAKRVLEFGPGSSTLALVEGGAEQVDTCEDLADWAEVYEERLVKRFPDIVRLHRYTWAEPLSIPAVDTGLFDLALIDGPLGTERRPDVLRYCLGRAVWVFIALEEHKTRAWMRPLVEEIAREAGVPVEIWETGPLSGAFALVGPTC